MQGFRLGPCDLKGEGRRNKVPGNQNRLTAARQLPLGDYYCKIKAPALAKMARYRLRPAGGCHLDLIHLLSFARASFPGFFAPARITETLRTHPSPTSWLTYRSMSPPPLALDLLTFTSPQPHPPSPFLYTRPYLLSPHRPPSVHNRPPLPLAALHLPYVNTTQHPVSAFKLPRPARRGMMICLTF